MEAEKLNNLSIEDYIILDDKAGHKYEYHDGEIFNMGGGTINHGTICGNIFGEIRTALKELNSSCKVRNSEIKVHVQSKNCFLYPDALVVCNDIKKSKTEPNSITNPTVIIEVLSNSTANYDRGDKFYLYRQLNSLQEYILIEQDKPQIDVHMRRNDLWKIKRIEGIKEVLQIKCLNISIPFAEIYYDVDFL